MGAPHIFAYIYIYYCVFQRQLEYLPACPLGTSSVPRALRLGGRTRPEGTDGGLYTPGGFENTEKKIPCSNDRFPAGWSLSQQREEQGDLFIFFLALPRLAMFF